MEDVRFELHSMTNTTNTLPDGRVPPCLCLFDVSGKLIVEATDSIPGLMERSLQGAAVTLPGLIFILQRCNFCRLSPVSSLMSIRIVLLPGTFLCSACFLLLCGSMMLSESHTGTAALTAPS